MQQKPTKWTQIKRFFRVRWDDWRAAVTLKLLKWGGALWTSYGVFVFVRDELASQTWQDRLTLGVLLPSISVWTWAMVLLLMFCLLSVEGIHQVSEQNRAAEERFHKQSERAPVFDVTARWSQFRAFNPEDGRPRFYVVIDDAAVTNRSEKAVSVEAGLKIEYGSQVPVTQTMTQPAKYKPLPESALTGFGLRVQYQLPQVIRLEAESVSPLGYFAFAVGLDLLRLVPADSIEVLLEKGSLWLILTNAITRQSIDLPLSAAAHQQAIRRKRQTHA